MMSRGFTIKPGSSLSCESLFSHFRPVRAADGGPPIQISKAAGFVEKKRITHAEPKSRL